jgi:hypothetical protein
MASFRQAYSAASSCPAGNDETDHRRVSHIPDAAWLAPRLPEIRERFSQWLAS